MQISCTILFKYNQTIINQPWYIRYYSDITLIKFSNFSNLEFEFGPSSQKIFPRPTFRMQGRDPPRCLIKPDKTKCCNLDLNPSTSHEQVSLRDEKLLTGKFLSAKLIQTSSECVSKQFASHLFSLQEEEGAKIL